MAVTPNTAKVRDLLLKAGLVDEYQMRSAVARVEQWGGRLPRVLADMGMVAEETVAQVLATTFRLPLQLLGTVPRDGGALSRLDVRFCEEHAVFPVSLNTRTNTMVLAVADPTALDVVDLVSSRVNARVQMVVSTESQILSAIARQYRGIDAPAVAPKRAAPTAGPAPALEIELDHSAPAPMRTLPPPRKHVPSANTLLDEMMGEDERARGFTQEELTRLGHLRQTHERTTSMLRALQELLREKGYLR